MAINDPTDIAGLFAWYDADSLVLNDGDPVASWPDGSAEGNDLAQATGSSQPTYIADGLNGRPVVRFENDYLRVALGSTITQPTTLFVLARMDGADVGRVLVDGDDSSRRQAFGAVVASVRDISIIAGSISPVDSGFEYPESDFTIWTLVFDETSSIMRRNGEQVATGYPGVDSIDGITLGCRYNITRFMDADVVQLAWYDSALSPTEIEDVEDYFLSPPLPGTPVVTGKMFMRAMELRPLALAPLSLTRLGEADE